MIQSTGSKTSERRFQDEVVDALVANGWPLRESSRYNRKLAFDTEDLLGLVRDDAGTRNGLLTRFVPWITGENDSIVIESGYTERPVEGRTRSRE